MRKLVLAIGAVAVIVAVVVVVRREPAKPEVEITGRTTTLSAPLAREVETVHAGVQSDDDPPGTLRLEGQVVDLDDAPIAGATVVVDSNPPRELKTEADGAFAFDGLTPRTYRLAARAKDAIAGPVSIRLAQRTEPVILRIRRAGTIVAEVSDDTGRPIAGALVELRDLVAITSITDASGKARLEGAAGGWHVIKASAEGHASAFRELATVTEGETRVALTLSAGASVAGTVVDTTGTPIEGARVLPEHLGHFDDYYDARYDAVLTDAKGRWRLVGLSRETTRIRAYHPEYAPNASAPIVLVDGGDRSGVTIVLERGGKLVGRVVDGQGAPVAGAEVRVSADTVLSGQVRRVAADARGRFEMGGLPRRTMFVMAATDDATSKTIPIDLAMRTEPLELVLDRTSMIEGIVVTSAGTPVPEARVVAERTRSETDTDQVESRLRGVESAIAGMDGRFRIAPLSPGSYLVRAIRPGSSSDLLGMRLGVEVTTGKEARVVVDELSTIVGKVALPDGTPVTSFAVRLGAVPQRRFESADGSFKIEDVPAGKQYLEVDGPTIVAHPIVDVVVEPRRTTDLGTITVSAGRTIAGTVVDRGGRPVAGAMVAIARELRADGTSLVPYPDHRVVQVATDAAGKFAIRGVGVGMQQLAAEHPTVGRSPMTTIQPGSTDADYTLTLIEPGGVQGYVRIDGKPAEALIVLRPESAADSRVTVRTGLDGSYRFDRVAPDRYNHIAVIIRGRRDENSDGKAQRIEVKPGEVLEVNVDLTDSGVAVVLHMTSPGDVVQFGYGLVAVIDDPAAEQLPLPRTISEGRAFGGKVAKLSTREGMIVSNRQITFERVPAGKQLACVAPLRADPQDPQTLAELQRGAADWPLYCKWVAIAAAPDPQHVTITVQPAPPPAAR